MLVSSQKIFYIFTSKFLWKHYKLMRPNTKQLWSLQTRRLFAKRGRGSCARLTRCAWPSVCRRVDTLVATAPRSMSSATPPACAGSPAAAAGNESPAEKPATVGRQGMGNYVNWFSGAWSHTRHLEENRMFWSVDQGICVVSLGQINLTWTCELLPILWFENFLI